MTCLEAQEEKDKQQDIREKKNYMFTVSMDIQYRVGDAPDLQFDGGTAGAVKKAHNKTACRCLFLL